MRFYLEHRVVLPRESKAAQSLEALTDAAGPVSQQHEVYVMLQMAVQDARQGAKGKSAREAACGLLLEQLREFTRRVSSAELEVMGYMTPEILASVIRTGFDPEARNLLLAQKLTSATATLPGLPPSVAWPSYVLIDQDWVRVEGTYHATFWAGELPRRPVRADWMAAMQLGSRRRRSISFIGEPVPPDIARRQAEAAILVDQSNELDRGKLGRRTTATEKSVMSSAERREQELAEGHCEFRFALYVTVSADSPDELATACREVEQQASVSGVQLRRERYQHDVALSCTLPLCRGLA
jgi:hypothetical protein